MPDLKLLDAEPTEAEREAIDAVVGAEAASGDRVARSDRHAAPPPAARAARGATARRLGDAGRARLCVAPARGPARGRVRRRDLLRAARRSRSGRRRCCTSAPTSRARSRARRCRRARIASPCLGLCELAPASLRTIAGEEPREVQLPRTASALSTATSSCAASPRASIRSRAPEFRALARARELGPERVIELVKASPLLGRGGAAFPTGMKWEAVARQPARPHYLVCNADESEPGTFKDRVLMEQDPFALVEAMAIAMYATGCEQGLHLRPRRVPARARAAAARDRRPTRASTSSCASAPARMSAARRRRSSSRSRATAASRATSRRSRSRSGSSASRRS